MQAYFRVHANVSMCRGMYAQQGGEKASIWLCPCSLVMQHKASRRSSRKSKIRMAMTKAKMSTPSRKQLFPKISSALKHNLV